MNISKTITFSLLSAIVGASILLNNGAPVNAQDGTEVPTQVATKASNSNCTPTTVLKSLGLYKSTGKPDADLATLLTLRDAITAQVAACNFNLAWKGNNNKVYGPIEFPSAGTYVANVVTSGFFASAFKTLSGDCGNDTHFFNIGQGEATNGSDAVLTIGDNCRALLATDNVSAPFVLTITKAE